MTWREYGGSGCLPCGYPQLTAPAWGRAKHKRTPHIPFEWGGGCTDRVVIVHRKYNLQTCQQENHYMKHLLPVGMLWWWFEVAFTEGVRCYGRDAATSYLRW